MSIISKADKYIAPTYKRNPLVITHGKGSLLYDNMANEYIDFGSGIAVNTFGTADQRLVDSITEQLHLVSHTSNLYYSEPQTRLAEVLCTNTGFSKVFFSNSGAEANECAIKAARKYYSDKNPDKQGKIICLKGGFHGRTITTLSATGQKSFHQHFHPFTEGFVFVEPNSFEDFANKTDNDTCAVILELIQGEGGVNVLDRDYVMEVAKFCELRDIILIIDEVQTGNGRTGKLFCYRHYGIKPDIVTTAKGLGGGLPIGATLFGKKVEATLTPGTHGSTFGGNPISAAAAISVMERLTDEFLSEVKDKGDYIIESLSGTKNIKSISGIGLMIGIETTKDASFIVDECQKNGLLVLSAKNKVRLLPPLNIPQDLLHKGIAILKEIIEK